MGLEPTDILFKRMRRSFTLSQHNVFHLYSTAVQIRRDTLYHVVKFIPDRTDYLDSRAHCPHLNLGPLQRAVGLLEEPECVLTLGASEGNRTLVLALATLRNTIILRSHIWWG